MKPGEWKLVKSCQCKGPSKPGSGLLPLPFCAICGKSWHIVGVLGTRPEIRSCVDCGENAPEQGTRCDDCREEAP